MLLFSLLLNGVGTAIIKISAGTSSICAENVPFSREDLSKLSISGSEILEFPLLILLTKFSLISTP